MLGQMKRQLENSRCFRQGMEKDLEECAEARWLAKPVLDSRALPLDSDNVRLQGPGVMSFEKKHTISGKGSIRLDVPTDGCRRHPSNRAFSVTTMMRLLPGENLERFNRISLWIYVCALPGFVDSKNEEKTERNAGYLVVSHSGGGMLRQGTRKGIRRTPANRGMRAHWVVKGLDISEDVCHGMCP